MEIIKILFIYLCSEYIVCFIAFGGELLPYFRLTSIYYAHSQTKLSVIPASETVYIVYILEEYAGGLIVCMSAATE